jgi:hypothetical protein
VPISLPKKKQAADVLVLKDENEDDDDDDDDDDDEQIGMEPITDAKLNEVMLSISNVKLEPNAMGPSLLPPLVQFALGESVFLVAEPTLNSLSPTPDGRYEEVNDLLLIAPSSREDAPAALSRLQQIADKTTDQKRIMLLLTSATQPE